MKTPVIKIDGNGKLLDSTKAYEFCLFLAHENNRHRLDIEQSLKIIVSMEKKFNFKVPRGFKMQWITP